MIKCGFYKLGQCTEPETKKFLKTSSCYECNSGKDAHGHKLKYPICVLQCNCEDETCNIGIIVGVNKFPYVKDALVPNGDKGQINTWIAYNQWRIKKGKLAETT